MKLHLNQIESKIEILVTFVFYAPKVESSVDFQHVGIQTVNKSYTIAFLTLRYKVFIILV